MKKLPSPPKWPALLLSPQKPVLVPRWPMVQSTDPPAAPLTLPYHLRWLFSGLPADRRG